jgi:hypothetical protein
MQAKVYGSMCMCTVRKCQKAEVPEALKLDWDKPGMDGGMPVFLTSNAAGTFLRATSGAFTSC